MAGGVVAHGALGRHPSYLKDRRVFEVTREVPLEVCGMLLQLFADYLLYIVCADTNSMAILLRWLGLLI